MIVDMSWELYSLQLQPILLLIILWVVLTVCHLEQHHTKYVCGKYVKGIQRLTTHLHVTHMQSKYANPVKSKVRNEGVRSCTWKANGILRNIWSKLASS